MNSFGPKLNQIARFPNPTDAATNALGRRRGGGELCVFHVEQYAPTMSKKPPAAPAKSAPPSIRPPTPGKSRLGRGLSSLMQVAPPPPSPREDGGPLNGSVDPAAAAPPERDRPPQEVPVDRIDPNPHQPRKEMVAESLAELAASIRTNGIIQPLVVIPRPDGRYELVAGERRLRAAKLAELATVPVVVRDVEAHEQAQMALVENVQREDLNPIDRAEAYRALQKQLGLTQSELAERVGEERSKVANHLRLLDLAGEVQSLVRDGRLPLGHAKVLAGVADAAEQGRLAELCAKQGLSVRNLERLVKEQQQPPAEPAKPEPAADGRAVYLKQLADNVSKSIGMRCDLSPTGKSGGKLTVHFKSLDQFDRLMEQLNVELE